MTIRLSKKSLDKRFSRYDLIRSLETFTSQPPKSKVIINRVVSYLIMGNGRRAALLGVFFKHNYLCRDEKTGFLLIYRIDSM